MKLKDRAREKAERRAARKNDTSSGGPQIAWDEAGGVGAVDRAMGTDDAPAGDDTGNNNDGNSSPE